MNVAMSLNYRLGSENLPAWRGAIRYRGGGHPPGERNGDLCHRRVRYQSLGDKDLSQQCLGKVPRGGFQAHVGTDVLRVIGLDGAHACPVKKNLAKIAFMQKNFDQ